MKYIKIFSLLGLSLLFACNNPTTEEQNEVNTKETPKGENNSTIKAEVVTKSNAMLLQGKWQHESDKNNYLVFENNLRKESADGGKTWDEETFTLADKCKNAGDAEAVQKPERDRYLSVEKSDLCWYIVSVSETQLSLSYMGRGNTLNYHKITK